MTNWKDVRQEWEQSDISFKALADKYGLKDTTIRSRKNREDWQRNDATQRKNVATNKSNAPANKEPTISIDGEGLTDKQILFVSYYLKYWNATKAYKMAYECDYATANANGPRLLVNASISEEIKKARDEIFADSLLTPKAIIQKYMDIAFADITDFIDFTQVTAEATETTVEYNPDGSRKSEKTEVVPYTYTKFALHHSEDIDGTLISELSKGKDGMFKIKLSDRLKALEKLEKYMGMMSEEQRLKIDKLKGEVALLEQQATKDDDKPIEIVIKRKGDA